MLIAGASPVGRELEKQISQNPLTGAVVVGYLDDDPVKLSNHADVIGTLSDAYEIIQTKSVDDVVIALPQKAYQRINQLIGELHQLPVKIWVIPDYFKLALYKTNIDEFSGIPMIDLRAPALSDYQRMVKRAFDVGITILLLPIALPFF